MCYAKLKDLRWLWQRGSPLPIPNREVKPVSADGTAICGRVCHRLFFKPFIIHLVKGFFMSESQRYSVLYFREVLH